MQARVLFSLGLIVCSAGCGKDEGKGDDGTQVPEAGMGGAAAGAGAGGASGASSAAGSGGASGASGMPSAGGTVAMMPEVTDAGVVSDAGEPAVVLPMDGNALSVCASSDDCNGDDLHCALFGSYQGYCAEDCAADDDCAAVGGIAPTCDDGVCVIDCASGDAGASECPEDMVCAEIIETAVDDPYYRCQYPEPKNRGVFEVCRDDAECKGELTCEVPGLLDLRATICTASCSEASDCEGLGGSATPVCDFGALSLDGVCALDCQEDDECPGGMTCIAVDPLTSRCGHEL